MEALSGAPLREYWSILVRRRWVVALSIVSVALLALIGSFLATPKYRATVTLQIERQNPDVLTFRDLSQMDSSWSAYSDFYQTQYRIISSFPVAELAVEDLGLESHPLFERGTSSPGLTSRLMSLLPSTGEHVAPDPKEVAAGMLLGSLEVSPVRNSHLVLVSLVGTDPQSTADGANAIARAYVRNNINSQSSTSAEADEFLLDQIAKLKDGIEESNRILQVYGQKHGIVSVDDNNNITILALQNISDKLTLAQTERARSQATFEALKGAPPESMPEVLNSPLIARLREESARYEAQFTETSRQFKANWPGLQVLESKLEQSRERLNLETQRIAAQVLSNAESHFRRAQAQEQQLARLLASQEQRAQQLNSDSIGYRNLLSDVRKKRETLDRLIKRQNELSLSAKLLDGGASTTNIKIMEEAKTPGAPFQPNTRLNLLLGLVFGAVLGAVTSLMLDYVDNTVKSVSDVQRLTTLPLLARIPTHEPDGPGSTRVRPRLQPRQAAQPALDEGTQSLDLVTSWDSRAAISEAYRELRTALLLSNPGQPPGRIMVTSAQPQEGKSATTVNLAIVLAQLGRRVLVVDTDLRRPRLHKALNADTRRGVSTYLSGLENDPFALTQPTSIPNLEILPSGPIPPNPSELLNSERFASLGRDLLAGGFDHVIFDSPPLLAVSDPVIIGTVVDSAILVVRSRQTPRQSFATAVDRLQTAMKGTKGIVLNDCEAESRDSPYHRYYYSSGTEEPVDDVVETNDRRGDRTAVRG